MNTMLRRAGLSLLLVTMVIVAGCGTGDDDDDSSSCPEGVRGGPFGHRGNGCDDSPTPEAETPTPGSSRIFSGYWLDNEEAAGGFVAAAGDLTGDGSDDFLVSGHGGDEYAGVVYVVSGSSAGGDLLEVAYAVFWGESVSYLNEAATGDFNSDGFLDLVMGAYGYNGQNGRFYVVYGPIQSGEYNNVRDAADVVWDGEGDVGSLGYALAAGDYNGDGIDDLAVSAPDEDGAVYIIEGPLPPTGSTMSFGQVSTKFVGVSGMLLGYSLSTGHFNKDEMDDLLIGAPGGVGSAYIVYGRDEFTAGVVAIADVADVVFEDAQGENDFGTAVVAGDINDNGLDDVIVGAPDSDNGTVYVFAGPLDTSHYFSSQAFSIFGEDSNDNAGSALTVGDINGDGFSDLVIGATGWNYGDGAVYLVLQPFLTDTSLNLTAADQVWYGAPDTRTGASVCALPDVTGDGADEVLYGAPDTNSDAYLGVGEVRFEAGTP